MLLKATSGLFELRGGSLALGKRCNITQTVEARNSETANIGQGGDTLRYNFEKEGSVIMAEKDKKGERERARKERQRESKRDGER